MNKTRKSFFKGLLYIASAKYSGILISLLITSILARVLSPSDYGIIAIATVFITFFTMLGDMGLGPAIIQFKNLSKDGISSIFGFSFWIAIGLSLLFFMFSGLIASFYNEPQLSIICKILSVQIFFAVLNIVPNALLSRDKKFNIIAYRNVIIQIITGIAAIIAAYRGCGVYSLVISPVATAILVFVVNEYKMRLRIMLIPEKEPLKIIFNFSLFQFLFGFVNYFNRNIDKLIIGRFISVQELGFYEKSYRLVQLPVHNINGVMGPVVHPYLSDFQNDHDKLKSIYLRMTNILINCSVILAVLLFVCSKEAILILFGDQWMQSITYFQIMSISVISQISSVIIGPFMQACNRTKVMFVVGLANTLIFLSSLTAVLYFYRSTLALCIVYVVVFVIEALTSYYAVSKYCFKMSIFSILRLFVKPLVLFALCIMLYLAFKPSIESFSIFLSLLIKVIFWGVISFLYLQNFTDYKPISYLSKFRNGKV